MKIDKSVLLARGSIVAGDVRIEKDSSIWFNAVVRAENASIIIEEGSNIQDGCIVHVDEGYPVHVGAGVTIGHGAIVHGCSIGDNTLIGMGAIVMNGARIGRDCIVAAGALVTQNTVVPDRSLVMGSPAKVRRSLTEEEIASNRENARLYVEESRVYKKNEQVEGKVC